MRPFRAGLGAAGVVLGVLVSACTTSYGSGSDTAAVPEVKPEGEREAHAAAERFLDRYVDADGRVVRRDQGGDTVSEGQAYALLLAVSVGDQVRFARVWTWTADNLQRPDGLLAWHWAKGRVADQQSATDADLDAARALVLAGKRFALPTYLDEARRIGAGILSQETATTASGRRVLVAGPWARGGFGAPITVNPSYIAPRAYLELESTTGDPSWRALADAGTADLRALTTNDLPPDWAVVDDAGAVRATSSPGGAPPGYGFDAVRVPVRLAESCTGAGRDVAARLWSRLRDPRVRHSVGLVGAAAAADAAGDRDARDRLLDDAERRDSRQPTYYGSAWVALGRVMLTTDLLGGCSG